MVFRVEKTKDYTVMSNYHLRDKNLSLKAKGLLSWMLSNDDDWDYSLAGIIACCKEGETTVNTALRELQKYGYVVIEKHKPDTDNNRIHYDYNVYEKPQGVDSQGLESLGLENQGLDFQGLENQVQRNTKTINTKERNKKENKKDISQKPRTRGFLKHSKQEDFKIDGLVDLYNSICIKLPKVRAITDKRKSDVEKLYKKYDLDTFKEVFEIANNSPFLTGDNDRNWKASFDFITREEKFVAILEGKYNSKSKKQIRQEEKERLFSDDGLTTCRNDNRERRKLDGNRKAY